MTDRSLPPKRSIPSTFGRLFTFVSLALGLGACGGSGGSAPGARIAGPPIFETRTEIETTSRGLTSVIAADWTGDGVVDILVSAAIDREIRLLVASAPGVFSTTAGARLSFADGPFDLVRGDFDADGDPDFACLFRRVSKIRVFLNDGRGSFLETDLLQTLAQPDALVAADLDGDGDDDLVAAASSAIEIFTSTSGRVARTRLLDVGIGVEVSSIWVGRLDADTYVDLAATDTSKNELFVWRGGPNGFDTKQRLLLSLPGKEPLHVEGGDATGDGIADLVVALYGSRKLAVFAGNGAGNYAQPTTIDVGGQPFDVRLGRLEGFLQPQLVVSYVDRAAVSIVEARSGGAFGPERQFGTSGLPTQSQIVDVDGDGRLDLLATSLEGSALSLLRGGSLGFNAAEDFALGSAHPEFVLASDFDGDGIDDAIVSDPDAGTCHVLVGQRNKPAERLRRVASLPTGKRPTLLTQGDFDRDGRADVAVATEEGLRILLNRSTAAGPGFVVWPSLASAAIPVGSGPLFELAVGRFDADGIDDLAVADRGGNQVSILFGSSTGLGFRDERRLLAMPGGPLSPIAGDFDRDGRIDLAVSAYDAGYVRVFRGDGLGGFDVLRDFQTSAGVNYLRSADLDGDGGLEFVASGSGLDEILIVDLDNPNATTRSIRVGQGPTALLVRDVNADTRVDLVVANWVSGDLSILLGDGAGGFLATPKIPAAFRAVSMTAGDFDGDGRFDLLLASQFTDRVTLLRSLR